MPLGATIELRVLLEFGNFATMELNKAIKARIWIILLHHDDVKAVNTEDAPMNVAPVAGPGGKVDGGKAEIKIPALSWNVLRFN